ncbi:putative family 31 glucosidase [Gracilariopsis chorda]|uniref:Putative family 31 glucosidase n=1 Tax=Gracilariopsis chorda TaxID=448386 RepID=A0A2V3IHI2_9FLOR|nr:putative family 31 glucosidase [Gracilariopsis chorda]|eukprot:PXF41522.1 putative family 31 glucosidase [Gracilariopsis chorda]
MEAPEELTIPSPDGICKLQVTLVFDTPTLTLYYKERHLVTITLSLPALTFPGRPYLSVDDTTKTHHFAQHDTGLSITPMPPSSFRVRAFTGSDTVTALIPIASDNWYGLGHLMYQHWPLNRARLEHGPFYPFDNGPTGICTLLEPTLYSSHGATIQVDDRSSCLHMAFNGTPRHKLSPDPLWWGTGVANFTRDILPFKDDGNGDGTITLQSRVRYDWQHVQHPWLSDESRPKTPDLVFTLTGSRGLRDACEKGLNDICVAYGPRDEPDSDTLQYPIWSTWARYKADVTQDDVIAFAEEIVKRGLPRSVMGIDDRWSTKYGDFQFDSDKFPDPKGMIDHLHELGFLVTLWITPFADLDSEAVTSAETESFFVKTRNGQIGSFDWWQPTKVAAVDLGNLRARVWFTRRLRILMEEYGVDGFKFDAGEPSFLPEDAEIQDILESPCDYTRAWVRHVVPTARVSEVRAGVRGCQSVPTLFRLFDRFSTWTLQNGLASVLAALLTAGILGYPFCIPDYIGGNAYGDEVPTEELMIRWAQASVAMPALQFSIPPWQFGEKCDRLCQEALKWRERFFWKHISGCIQTAADSYVPICRPMWWLRGPNEIFDQFLIGNDVIVAPVINKGQRKRNVFLSQGFWKKVDLSKGKAVGERLRGPVWLRDISADLHEMPTYLRS